MHSCSQAKLTELADALRKCDHVLRGMSLETIVPWDKLVEANRVRWEMMAERAVEVLGG